jgi:hypothetical protein
LIGPFRKFFNNESAKLTDTEIKHYYIESCKKRITELESEYAELIEQPYQAGRLSEIISELGNIWNERLRYEDIDNEASTNGAKSLWQVQNDVSSIVQEAKQQIARAKKHDNRSALFAEALVKLRQVLDEWEIEQ